MKPEVAQEILERLCRIEKSVTVLAKQHAHTAELVKEIRKAMAITQADINEVKATQTAILAEISKIGADLTAVLDNPALSLDEVKAQGREIASRLQALDDLVPEQS